MSNVAGAVGRFADLVLRGRGNPVLSDPEICLDLFWPAEIPNRFEDLAVKTVVVATHYLDRNQVACDTEVLRPASGGSIAVPGLSYLAMRCSSTAWL
jgi:NTE family protein